MQRWSAGRAARAPPPLARMLSGQVCGGIVCVQAAELIDRRIFAGQQRLAEKPRGGASRPASSVGFFSPDWRKHDLQRPQVAWIG